MKIFAAWEMHQSGEAMSSLKREMVGRKTG